MPLNRKRRPEIAAQMRYGAITYLKDQIRRWMGMIVDTRSRLRTLNKPRTIARLNSLIIPDKVYRPILPLVR